MNQGRASLGDLTRQLIQKQGQDSLAFQQDLMGPVRQGTGFTQDATKQWQQNQQLAATDPGKYAQLFAAGGMQKPAPAQQPGMNPFLQSMFAEQFFNRPQTTITSPTGGEGTPTVTQNTRPNRFTYSGPTGGNFGAMNMSFRQPTNSMAKSSPYPNLFS